MAGAIKQVTMRRVAYKPTTGSRMQPTYATSLNNFMAETNRDVHNCCYMKYSEKVLGDLSNLMHL